jgi:hypothetical protein
VVAMLFIAGDHVPAIPLFEVVGNAANVLPEHIAATCVNKGAIAAIIVILSVAIA